MLLPSADWDEALKNADDMLRSVLQTVDTSGDGHIQYSGTIIGALAFWPHADFARAN